LANSFKPSYRRKKAVMSTSVKVIIILLVVLVLTLSAFLIKIAVEKALDPGIVYPPDETGSLVTAADGTDDVTTAPEEEKFVVRSYDKSKFDAKAGTLLLVNRETAYTLPETQKLVNLYEEKHENFSLATISEQLTREAYEALCKMTDAYAERTGFCPLMVTSAYRDEAQQKKYYDDYVVNESDKDYVELPGYSDHHTGLAFDVKIYDKDGASFSYGRYATEKVGWIVENYKYYGFIMRYPANKGSITGIDGESNHFRYVGLPHSVYITEKNMCLEEYLTFIKNYTYDDPLEVTVDNDEYAVWYCKDAIYVPKDGDYTVSSDNSGGFIVTYRK
jgi:D-alanyl-D-alanine carboxypeptidase